MSNDKQRERKEHNAQVDAVAAEIREEQLHGATFEPDIGKVLEETPPPKPPVVIKPGNYYARRAWENGEEDEYSNRMKARYGGEW